MVGAAVKGLSEQVERSARESRAVYDQASRRLRASRALADRLGSPVTVGPVVSQSVSSSSINGVSSRRLVLLVPVQGPLGAGQAQVTSVDEPPASGNLSILVSCDWAGVGVVHVAAGWPGHAGLGFAIELCGLVCCLRRCAYPTAGR
jgi:hypothetical protein